MTHNMHGGIPLQPSAHLTDARDPAEDWTGKTASTERRKLQNRLNQRARRRRQTGQQPPNTVQGITANLLETKSGSQLILTHDQFQSFNTHQDDDARNDQQPRCLLGRPAIREALIRRADEARRFHQLGSLNTAHLTEIARFNIFHAFARNALALGFDNAWLKYEATSPFNRLGPRQAASVTVNGPPNMQPTALQVAVGHHPWIDFFPCPRMRDNFLGAVLVYGEDGVDEDDMCRDVVDVGAATGVESAALIVWGEPWSLSGWEITESFLKKWGWLLDGCVELQDATNTWRSKRGLRKLAFSDYSHSRQDLCETTDTQAN